MQFYQQKAVMVPYRHSKLTELFKSSFEGDGKAVMVVNVNPFDTGFDENSHVMKFAAVAKDVATWRRVHPKLELSGDVSTLSKKRRRNKVYHGIDALMNDDDEEEQPEGMDLDKIDIDLEEDEEEEEEEDDGTEDPFVDNLISQLDELRNKVYINFDFITVKYMLSSWILSCLVDWSRNEMCYDWISSAPTSRKRNRDRIEANGRHLHVIFEEGGNPWQKSSIFFAVDSADVLERSNQRTNPRFDAESRQWPRYVSTELLKTGQLLIISMHFRFIKGTFWLYTVTGNYPSHLKSFFFLASRQTNSTLDRNG